MKLYLSSWNLACVIVKNEEKKITKIYRELTECSPLCQNFFFYEEIVDIGSCVHGIFILVIEKMWNVIQIVWCLLWKGFCYRRISEGWDYQGKRVFVMTWIWKKDVLDEKRVWDEEINWRVCRTKVACHPGVEGTSAGAEGDESDCRSMKIRGSLKDRFDCCRMLVSLKIFE